MQFSTLAALIFIPHNSVLGFPFLHNLPSTCSLWIYYDGHSDQYLIVVLILIPLMVSDAEHPFIYLWTFCMPSLEECMFIFCPFFIWIFCLPRVELCVFFIYLGDQTLVRVIIGKYIFSFSWFPFHFAGVFLSCEEAFDFDEVPFVYSFLYVPCSIGYICENIAAWNISHFPAYVLLLDFYGIMTYI